MFCLALLAAFASHLWAQDLKPSVTGTVVVRVRGAGGAPLDVFAVVHMYSEFTSVQQTSGTHEGSQVVFTNIPIGEYQIEVTAPGYLTAKQEASLLSVQSWTYVYVDLRPEGAPGAQAPPNGPPVLAPKAQAALESGVAAIRAGDLKKAQESLDKARKLAPQHPDVLYVLGLFYLRQQNYALARASFERALMFYPDHFPAQSALGTLLYQAAEYKAAIAALEKAVWLRPLSWQSHEVLALCLLREQSYEKALAHAERALEIAESKAPELHLLLARALMARKQFDRAQQEISAFLRSYPAHPDVPEAKQLLEEVKRQSGIGQPASGAAVPAVATKSAADSRRENALPVATADAARSVPASQPELAPALPEPVRYEPNTWTPPSVDDAPPVLLKTTCKLPEVLAGVGKRATALAANLQRVTALEEVEQSDLDANGIAKARQTDIFDYLVSISEPRPGNLSVEEHRIAIARGETPPRFITSGLGALALIFHPYYVKDYEMRCEGLTEINGQPAWSVYFKQRAGIPSRIRSYQTVEGTVSVALKGRAWIAANNLQVLRLETDLAEPIKRLRLEREHLVVEYGPVSFKTRSVRLWLPASAEMYAHFRGRRFAYQHRFTDYKVFSVDVSQEIGERRP